jgi:RNA polymerase sigma factor (sigma-70 family)
MQLGEMPTRRMVVDPAVVVQAQAGDSEAMQSLLSGVWAHAYRLAWSVVRDAHLAEDAAQEACAKALRAIGSLRDPEAFAGWFCRIVLREAHAQLRASRRIPLAAARLKAGMWPQISGLADLSAFDNRLDLRAAIAALPPAYREATVLHYYGGMQSTEIGRILGVSAATVRFRLATARALLRRSIGEAGMRSALRPTERLDTGGGQ